MKTALLFRELSKPFKELIDSQHFGLAFMQRFKINTQAPRCQEILVKNTWIAVFREWMQTPLTITLLDYSNSMNGGHPSGNQTHLQVAQEILSDVFQQQQQKLRPPFFIYLFGKTASKYKIRSEKELNDLQLLIDQNSIVINRKYNRLQSTVDSIANEEQSPLRRKPFLTHFEIQLISDCDISKKSLGGSINTIVSNTASPFTFTLIPTTVSPNISIKWNAAQEQRNKSKRKDSITLFLDTSQAAKRLKVEQKEDEIT